MSQPLLEATEELKAEVQRAIKVIEAMGTKPKTIQIYNKGFSLSHLVVFDEQGQRTTWKSTHKIRIFEHGPRWPKWVPMVSIFERLIMRSHAVITIKVE